MTIEGIGKERIICGNTVDVDVMIMSSGSMVLDGNDSKYSILIDQLPGREFQFGQKDITGLAFEGAEIKNVTVRLSGIHSGQVMGIRLCKYVLYPEHELGIADAWILVQNEFVYHGSNGSWVMDANQRKALDLASEWNRKIETGELQMPAGSYYFVCRPKLGTGNEAGIYFVDPTAT